MKKPNCYHCDNYKNGYCDALDLQPCYPEKGCDYFEPHMSYIQEIKLPLCDEVKKLSERVDNLEKKIIEEKDNKIEKLKAELDYAKFRCSLPDINIKWWECKKCGKMIPYMANFCNECADEILGDPPESEEK